MTDRLEFMFTAQREMQEKAYGYDFDAMTDDERIQFIKNMVLATSDELHELLGETGWKPWAKSKFINHHEYRKEVVDIFHFFMNLMLVVGMTTDELYEGYVQKRQINIQRQLREYDGVSSKMPCCQRAVEDVSFTEVRKLNGALDFVICVCGDRVDAEFIRKNAELLPDLQIS